MCGIAGFFPYKDLSASERETIARKMAGAIAHRGPDMDGVWLDETSPLVMAHRRLSILDLSEEGRQPMHSASGRYVIVYNGEVYNYRSLQEELRQDFRGHSDTEVMLAAMEEWGLEAAVKRFEGMFAFALYDRQERVLHFVRDRFGKKPLYLAQTQSGFYFASELKAITAVQNSRPEIDRSVVAQYLYWRYVPSPHCIYKNFWKIEPATIISLPLDKVQQFQRPQAFAKAYWSIAQTAEAGQREPFEGGEEDALNQLDEVLSQAVQERMISDVPLGAFLSGGVDSSLILALMRKGGQSVQSFTIGFEEGRYDEMPFARQVARHLGSDHQEYTVTPGATLETVERLPEMFDEPFGDPSTIPTWHICAMAKKDVTVVLSGDGGDEIFGGYGWYRKAQGLNRLFGAWPQPMRNALAALIVHTPPALAAPFSYYGAMTRPQLEKLAGFLRAGDLYELYARMITYGEASSTAIMQPPFEPLPTRPQLNPADLSSDTERLMVYDSLLFLPDDVLVKLDRTSMDVSLEARCPLLDSRVADFVWRLPLTMKIKGKQQKYILKQLLRRYLPEELIDRPKWGFSIPHSNWLRGPLKSWAADLLDAKVLGDQGFIKPEEVQKIWQAHQSGKADYGHALWTIVMFQQWMRRWG